ncbi:MAG: glycosyltransferase [Clostridiales bacterium]|nr:glycosyltransferase [Clostridiales bacterium]
MKKAKKHKYKIVVYAIAKDEEQFVDRWMDSMSEADEVVVLDTGSSDNTVKKLKARGAKVYQKSISPWRFDAARNESLKLVSKDADICVCTDLDEVFNKGWRAILEKAWQPDAKQARYLYNWSLDAQGKPLIWFYYFKIHSRHNFVWQNPVHEYLKYTGSDYKAIYIDGIVLNHYPDPNKSRSCYLPLLELAVQENPEDDRSWYYLGREYVFLGQYDQSIQTLQKYLSLKSDFAQERCAAMRDIAKCYLNKSDYLTAYKYYIMAIAHCPYMREAYVELALAAYYNKDYTTVFFMAEQAQNIKQDSKTYINQSYAWDSALPDIASVACFELKLYDKAYYYAKQAFGLNQNDTRIKDNYELIKRHYSKIPYISN